MKKLLIIVSVLTYCCLLKAQENILPDTNQIETKSTDTIRLKFRGVRITVITEDLKKEKKDIIAGKQEIDGWNHEEEMRKHEEVIRKHEEEIMKHKNEIMKEGKEVMKQEKGRRSNRKNHWAGIDLGISGYLSTRKSFGMIYEDRLFELDYSRSRTWNLNFIEKNFKIIRNYAGIVTGMGVSLNRYHFNERQTALIPDADITNMVLIGAITRKHFLSSSYLTIPWLLEFNTHRNPGKSFHIAGGLIGGYRLGSKSVRVVEFTDEKRRLVVRDDYNLAPFNLSTTVRFGLGNLNFFVTYTLTELFNKGKGPELFPVSAGVTLIGFNK